MARKYPDKFLGRKLVRHLQGFQEPDDEGARWYKTECGSFFVETVGIEYACRVTLLVGGIEAYEIFAFSLAQAEEKMKVGVAKIAAGIGPINESLNK
jgi:hypothetical protein